MKRPKLLSTLILIASALLLSAASNVTAEGPSEPNQRSKTQPSPQAYSQIASPTMTATLQPTATPTAQAGATYTYNEYKQSSPWGDLPTWLEAIATIGLVVFAFWQMDFVRRSTDSMEAATTAAGKAADTAERALIHAERAWLAFEVVDIQGLDHVRARIERLLPLLREPADSPTIEIIKIRVRYRLNNCGRTPARLIAGDIQFVCANPTSLPQKPAYPHTETPESLMPPGLSATNSKTIDLYPPGFEQFVEGRENLIIFGYVRYRDVVGDPRQEPITHETRFRMECRFPGYVRAGDGKVVFAEPWYFQYTGPEAYNRYT